MVDWAKQQLKFASALTDELRDELALLLGVEAIALVEIGLGWNDKDGCWTFPMFDGTGVVLGVHRRWREGEAPQWVVGNKAAEGSTGVFRRVARPDDGPLAICEGASDTAALLSYGQYDAIGLPSASTKVEFAINYARNREVMVFADNDEKGAGLRSAEKVAEAVRSVATSVRIIKPPAEFKDLRAWRNAGATGEDIEAVIRATRDARPGFAPSDVIDRWKRDGPIVHVETGFETLDKMTGGGPPFGCRVYLLGAPDAGKTALLVELAHNYAKQGIAVGLLAVDEEPSDLLTRVLQRLGFTRRQCEERDQGDLERMRAAVADLPIRFYDVSDSIESAARDLASLAAKATGGRAVLGVDSIQTVRCASEDERTSRYEMVTARVAAIRSVSDEYQMLVVATSEMSRAAYRAIEAADRSNPMAAAKESGAIEYSARLLLSLTSVLGESDMVEMNIVKNKLGPPHARGERIILRIDRARQEFHEDPDYSAPEQVERGAKKAAHRVAQSYSDAASLAVHLAHNPGLLTRALRAAANLPSLGGMGVGRCDSAKETLENALIKRSGPRRSFVHYLDGSQLPPAVLDKVPMHHRPKVVAAKPPGVEEAAPNDGAGLDAKSAPEA